jgi:replicative DNA helicase
MPTYSFDVHFQHKLIGLVRDGAIASSSVHSTNFQNPILSELIIALVSLHKLGIAPITKRILYNEALKARLFREREYREDLKEAINLIYQPCRDNEKLFILKSVKDFNRLQAYKQAILHAEDLLQDPGSATLEQLDQIFAAQLQVDMSDSSPGDFYFSGLAERLKARRRDSDVIMSLIPPLDRCLDGGGFAPEELNVLIGLPSAGKTFALLHLAKAAIAQKKKVVFFSLEMTSAKLASRLDAAYLGVETRNLRDHTVVLGKTLKKLQREFGDSLLLKKMPAGRTSIADLSNALHAMDLCGFTPDVLVLDYMNLMAPPRQSREGRHRDLGQVYIDLKGLIQARHMWLFTAAQSNREGANVKVITLTNMADSFEGAMHGDVVISLNRDDNEAAREKLRLYLAKDKNGIDKKIISISTNYAKGAFFRVQSEG